MHIENERRSIWANAFYKASQVKYLLVESNDAEGCLRMLATTFFAVRRISCPVLQTFFRLRSLPQSMTP